MPCLQNKNWRGSQDIRVRRAHRLPGIGGAARVAEIAQTGAFERRPQNFFGTM
jgi:hypothetical protein